MPRLPQGLTRRRVRTKSGVSKVWVWRRTIAGKDVRVALGTDYSKALVEYRRLEVEGPPMPAPATSLAAPPPTVETFSRRWLAEYASTQRTKRYRDQTEQRMRDYLWPNLGAMPLADLKPSDIRCLNATLEAKRVGLVTRRRTLEDLRCMLRYGAEEAGVLERSPWVSGKKGLLPRLPESAPEPLNEMELAEVVRVAPERWKPVLLMLAYTGLRWGELRALRWKDVREAPYPHLVISRSHSGPTKSRRVREVPLLPEAQEVLNALTRSTGTVFSLPETASWIRRHVIRHSWVKDFHVHRLRHTFACRYLERGGSIETLQQVLGHSTVKLTERYARLRPEVVAAEVRKISRDGTVDGTVPAVAASESRN
jgi:integrase